MARITNPEVYRLMDRLANVMIEQQTDDRMARIYLHRIEDIASKKYYKSNNSDMVENIHVTGSTLEGMSDHVINDVDTMLVMRVFPIVCWEPQQNEKQGWGFLIAEQNKNDPAYLRLKVMDKYCLYDSLIKFIDNDDYLMSKAVNDYMDISMNKKNPGNFTNQGPSITDTFSDYVQSFKCQSWPPFTDDFFFKRKRQNNWPSRELLNKVYTLDCLVVAVSHPSTLSKDTEWRLSFSLAEKLLIQELPDKFAKCMYCLKLIKSKYIIYSDSDRPTPFCSYFIKTACLWMSESYSFTNDDSMNSIKKVLDWLIDRYEHRYLPHYFIPQQNLIGHLSKKHCDGVCTKLTAVKEDLWVKLMSSIKGSYNFSNFINGLISTYLNKASVDDYAELASDLKNNPRALGFLSSAIGKLSAVTSELPCRPIICTIQPHFVFFDCHLVGLIKKSVPPLEILRCPEEIVLPVIANLEDIGIRECKETFKIRLYRYLGDVYTSLLVCLRSRCVAEDLAAYKNKPLHYYELGAELTFPNKLSDLGVGGKVLVIKYHYLMGNYELLKRVLTEFENELLPVDEKTEYLNRLLGIPIRTCRQIDLSYMGWANDELLQNAVKCLPDLQHILHPILVVFYIMARVSLNDGDTTKASKIVKDMKGITPHVWSDDSTILIEILESLIGLLKVTQIIYCSI